VYCNAPTSITEPLAPLTEVIRRKHPALATERTCRAWLRRYCGFLRRLPLQLAREHKLERFLVPGPIGDRRKQPKIKLLSRKEPAVGVGLKPWADRHGPPDGSDGLSTSPLNIAKHIHFSKIYKDSLNTRPTRPKSPVMPGSGWPKAGAPRATATPATTVRAPIKIKPNWTEADTQSLLGVTVVTVGGVEQPCQGEATGVIGFGAGGPNE
jgi:hypothetical protein